MTKKSGVMDAALPSAGTMTTIAAYFRLIRLASEDDADRWVRKSASVADFLTAQVVGEARRDVSNAYGTKNPRW
jgi:hypothetical protein